MKDDWNESFSENCKNNRTGAMTLTDGLKDRVKGCIYGQAVGDALGLGTEFMTRAEVRAHYPDGLERYEQIVRDAHRRRWEPGAWTDDTDMMICIAKARHDNLFDLGETAANFKEWFRGAPMGIGGHTNTVLSMPDYTRAPIKAAEIVWRLNRCRCAANGGIMRTSILGTSCDVDEEEVADICRLTHPDARCIGSCVIIVRIIQSLIFHNVRPSVDDIVTIANRYDARIEEYIRLSMLDDPTMLSLDDSNMGYTLKTLGIALWSLWHCNSFKDGLLTVVNLGGDADTNAAVSCALLGAKYGFSGIPSYYTENLADTAVLDEIYRNAISDLSEYL